MKVAHRNKVIDKVVEHKPQELLADARNAEAENNISEAITLYEKVIKTDDMNEFAYNRLMILYRREKETEKEIKLINKGVAAFERHYKTNIKHNRTISSVSEKLNKALGLTDKKGIPSYEPEPIARWKKRKMLLEQRNK